MKKTEAIMTALLVAIAVEGFVTARAIRRVAQNGFNIELTVEQADSLAQAARQAMEDIRESD